MQKSISLKKATLINGGAKLFSLIIHEKMRDGLLYRVENCLAHYEYYQKIIQVLSKLSLSSSKTPFNHFKYKSYFRFFH